MQQKPRKRVGTKYAKVPEVMEPDKKAMPINPTTPPAKPGRSSWLIIFRKYWLLDLAILLLFLGIIADIHRQEKGESEVIVLQKGVGFGIAICAIACCMIFVWRLARFFAKDEQSAETSEATKTSDDP